MSESNSKESQDKEKITFPLEQKNFSAEEQDTYNSKTHQAKESLTLAQESLFNEDQDNLNQKESESKEKESESKEKESESKEKESESKEEAITSLKNESENTEIPQLRAFLQQLLDQHSKIYSDIENRAPITLEKIEEFSTSFTKEQLKIWGVAKIAFNSLQRHSEESHIEIKHLLKVDQNDAKLQVIISVDLEAVLQLKSIVDVKDLTNFNGSQEAIFLDPLIDNLFFALIDDSAREIISIAPEKSASMTSKFLEVDNGWVKKIGETQSGMYLTSHEMPLATHILSYSYPKQFYYKEHVPSLRKKFQWEIRRAALYMPKDVSDVFLSLMRDLNLKATTIRILVEFFDLPWLFDLHLVSNGTVRKMLYDYLNKRLEKEIEDVRYKKKLDTMDEYYRKQYSELKEKMRLMEEELLKEKMRLKNEEELKEKMRLEEKLLKEKMRLMEEELLKEKMRLKNEEELKEKMRLEEKLLKEKMRLMEEELLKEKMRLKNEEELKEKMRLEEKLLKEKMRLMEEDLRKKNLECEEWLKKEAKLTAEIDCFQVLLKQERDSLARAEANLKQRIEEQKSNQTSQVKTEYKGFITPKSGTLTSGLGLELVIPENSVKTDIPISIKKIDYFKLFPSSALKGVELLSPVFEIQPHHATPFEKCIQIRFQGLEYNRKTQDFVGLLVQKDSKQDRQLNKWYVIPPDSEAPFTFSVSSFSFMFLGKMKEGKYLTAHKNPHIVDSTPKHQIINSGLNYQVNCKFCCKTSEDYIMVHRPGCAEYEPGKEKRVLKCTKCSQLLGKDQFFERIILFECKGQIDFCLENEEKSDNNQFDAKNGQLVLYGCDKLQERYDYLVIKIDYVYSNNKAVLSFNKGAQHHVVFVLDASGSMDGTPWSSVLSALDSFVEVRKSQPDLLSIITFGNSATPVVTRKRIEEYYKYNTPSFGKITFTGGGTNYDGGLKSALEVFKGAGSKYVPVLFFLSDGAPNHGQDGINWMKHLNKEIPGLKVVTLAFGGGIQKLKELAAAATDGRYADSLNSGNVKDIFECFAFAQE